MFTVEHVKVHMVVSRRLQLRHEFRRMAIRYKTVMPSIGNEVVTLVKDTALAQTIGIAELFRSAQNASARIFSVMPIFIAGVFYFIMNAIVSKAFDYMEKHLWNYR